jgi:carbohydrate-selective porin OprB
MSAHWLTAAALLLLASASPAHGGEETAAAEKASALSWNFDAVLDAIITPRRNAVEWNFEASLPIELDLGELAGLDHFFLYAHPTLVWGAEEDHQWDGRLYQAWLSYDGSERWNVLAGIYDVGWHFHSLPSTRTFTRLPGQNTGSFSPGSLGLLDLFRLSSPAIRIELKPTDRIALQVAAVRLQPEHGVGQHALAEHLADANRTLLIAQAGWSREGADENRQHHARIGLGGWLLPGARLADSPRTPFGLYVYADARLHSEVHDADQGCSAFLSLSAAAQRPGTWEKRVATGLAWTGLLPARDTDETALAVITEDAGEPSYDARGRRRWRTSAELLHRIPLGDHAYVQGALQWRRAFEVAERPDAWRIGLSLGLSF